MRRTALQNHSADGFGPQIVQWKEEAASEPVFVKGTEFAAFRPPEASLTMTGEEATVADLRDVAGFLQHLEEKMARIQAESAELLGARAAAPAYVELDPRRLSTTGEYLGPRALRSREVAELAGAGLFPLDDDAARRRADGAVEGYLKEFKYRKRLVHRCVKIQSYERMRVRLRCFRLWVARRRRKLRHHVYAWRACTNADLFFDKHCLNKNFHAWREQARANKQQRAVTWAMFERRLGREQLTVCAVNLFFDAQDMPPPPSANIEAVNIGIRRKIYKLILRGWTDYLIEQRRNHVAAAMALERALRKAPGKRLVVETVHLAYHMWRRLAQFKKAVRAMRNPPRFATPQLPEWDAYVLLFTQRRVRRKRAEKRGRAARARRCHRAWRDVVVRRRLLEDAVERSRAQLMEAFMVQALREWNAFCRTRGRTVRRTAVYFAAWAQWAPRKRRLRRAKVQCVDKANGWCGGRAIRAWVARVHSARVLYAYQLARGLALRPDAVSADYERRVDEEVAARDDAKEDNAALGAVKKAAALDGFDARVVHARRYHAALSSGLLFCDRGPHWALLQCLRAWKKVVKRIVVWRQHRFLYLRGLVNHLARTVLLAWQSVASGAPVPGLLPNGARLSLDPLRPLDRASETAIRLERGHRADAYVDDHVYAFRTPIPGPCRRPATRAPAARATRCRPPRRAPRPPPRRRAAASRAAGRRAAAGPSRRRGAARARARGAAARAAAGRGRGAPSPRTRSSTRPSAAATTARPSAPRAATRGAPSRARARTT